MRHKRIWAALVLALGACALPAQAAMDAAELLPLSLEELIATPVVTASRRSEVRQHTPTHIVVITRGEIRERGYRNLADLLEDQPGVDFQRGTRSAQLNNFALQGNGSNNKLAIMLDGVRIDHPAGGKIAVAENFPLYFARQVEILYGPAAALYGADALAGVVNIISERPADSQGAWVSVGAGRYDAQEKAAMAGVRLGEGIALSVGAHLQRSDRAPLDALYPDEFPRVDARTFGGEVVVPAAEREPYVGAIRSESRFARLDVGEALSFGYFANGLRHPTSTGDRPDTALYLNGANWISESETFYGKGRFELRPDLQGELLLNYSRYQVDPHSKYVNVFTDFGDHGYDYVKAWRQGIEQSFTWTLDPVHTLLAGIGYARYYALETPDLPAPYDRDKGVGNQGYLYEHTDLPVRIFDVSYRNTSAYLQWQADWTPAFNTMVGVRYDKHSAYGDSVNPRLGAVWTVAPGSYLKLFYGEGFRAPSPEESLSSFGSFSGEQDAAGNYLGSGFRAPNYELEPETLRSWSLTWDWRPRADLNLVASAYKARLNKLIVTADESVSSQYIPGAVLSRTTTKVNAGEEAHYGVDLSLRWRALLGGPWSGDLWGSYSYLHGSVQEGSETVDWDLPNVAEHKLKLGYTLRHGERYAATLRARLSGDVNSGRKDRDHPGRRVQVDGYSVADLRLAAFDVASWRGLSAFVDVYNLFDRRYEAAHGSASSTFVGVPQQPRTWMFTLEQRF